jgi:hypothetical protein
VFESGILVILPCRIHTEMLVNHQLRNRYNLFISLTTGLGWLVFVSYLCSWEQICMVNIWSRDLITFNADIWASFCDGWNPLVSLLVRLIIRLLLFKTDFVVIFFVRAIGSGVLWNLEWILRSVLWSLVESRRAFFHLFLTEQLSLFPVHLLLLFNFLSELSFGILMLLEKSVSLIRDVLLYFLVLVVRADVSSFTS